jgi:hypothetical protein
MKTRLISSRFWGSSFVLFVTINALTGIGAAQGDSQGNRNSPVSALTAIHISGNPVTSSDIAWTDPGTGRYYFADRSNFGVDIIDARKDVWVGRVGNMAGPLPSRGGTALSNGPGPNGVVVTPQARLWAGDGNATVQVADVDPDSPNYEHIIASVSTAIGACDGGTANSHYCGRADEIDYDPDDHTILIANPGPFSTAPPHMAIDPYATLINADPPYNVIAHTTFAGAGGLEQPRWDPQIGKFLLTVPGKIVGGVIVTQASIHVINPKTGVSEKTYPIDCAAIAGTNSVSVTGIVLRPNQHILVSACNYPIILTLDEKSSTVNVIQVIKQVGGGDQVWYNPGDGRFYVTGTDFTVAAGVQSLGVINANTSTWLQNVPDVRGKNPAALAENDHIFTIVQITAAIAGGAADNSICATQFNLIGTGCVAVFTHQK